MSRSLTFIVLCVTLLFYGADVRADVSDFDLNATPAEGAALAAMKEDVEFALAGLRASREQLQRAQFRLLEHRIEETGGKVSEVDIKCTMAFDNDPGLLRVEYEQTEPLPHPHRFTYVEDGSDEGYYYDHQGSFTTVNNGYLKNEQGYPPIDVRTIGLGLYYDYVLRGQVGAGLDTLQTALLETVELVDVKRDSGKIAIDYFPASGRRSRFRLVLDESREFIPLTFEAILQDRDSEEWRSSQITTTTWTQAGGMWLPETLTSTLEVPRRELKVAFEWLSVNETLDPALFSKDSFELPDGTYVVDQKLVPNRPTLVKVVGQPTGEEYLDRRSGVSRLLIGLNVVALVSLVVAIFVWKKRGKK